MDDDSSTPEFPSSRRSVRRGSSWRRSGGRNADRSRSGPSGGPDEEDFPPFDFEPPPHAARGSASGKAGGGSKSPAGDFDPPEGSPPQEAAPPVPLTGAAPPPSGGAGGDAPLQPNDAGGTGGSGGGGGPGGGGDDDLPPFAFEPPAGARPMGHQSPRRGAAHTRITRRERQKQIRRHRLIVLGVFVVVLIILVIIIVKACGGGGGAAQPKPHKTKVHKTAAGGGVKPSASPIDVAVNAVQVTRGEPVAVDYRIDGPVGVKGNVKIVVKDKSGTVKELFTLGSAQPTNRDLVYRFLAVLDPGTYSLSVQVTLTSGQSASGSSRLTIVSSGGATPSPTST